ncbi:MAG: hypothetical protein KC535_05030 [Nanoarchaeota archaeon]|nr:hypothetical protein [Nanoarchaeota archaeon]
MLSVLDTYKPLDNLLVANTFNNKYTIEVFNWDKKSVDGVIAFIARKGDHILDRNIAATVVEICQGTGINIIPEHRKEKTRPYLPDFEGENWHLFKPYVFTDTDNLAKSSLVPAQLHINEKLHIYVLDNENIIRNMQKNLLYISEAYHYTRMHLNTYGKMVSLKPLPLNTKLASIIEAESTNYSRFKDEWEKEPQMVELPIFRELAKSYRNAGEEIDFFIDESES